MKLLFILLILQIHSNKSGRRSEKSEGAHRCYCGEVDSDFSDKDLIPIEEEYIPSIRIIHGKDSERNEWPWMALLMINPTKDINYEKDKW